jgi:uncharacterized membrane protein
VLVVRQIHRPELDLVRNRGRIDDPSGGVFNGARDAPPRWLPGWLRPPTESESTQAGLPDGDPRRPEPRLAGRQLS